MTAFRLIERPEHVSVDDIKEGDTVYSCKKCTYGLVSDDEGILGEPCEAITADPEGGYPFYVVKRSQLEALS